ncbi:MAG TPA: glycosyltransferase family 2 protein [Aggregatilineales bacterium]|nr:glycosyltransferase family 2 protein [Aggregatilineales bacterium]
MLDIAVVIVTWNVRELVLEAIRSLYVDIASSGLAVEVWVVDSASSDGTIEAIRNAFPQTHLIASTENLGFGRANNLALHEIGFGQANPGRDLPTAVYLLNPDTITHLGSTRILYDVLLSQPTVGLIGAHLSYGDGTFQHSAFGFPGLRQLWVEFFPTPGRLIEGSFNGRYPQAAYAGSSPFPVDCVLGATMMLRREVIEQTGMFDEQYFMYCEEIDWAWRIHKAGWQVYCVPTARVTHLGGQSTGLVRPRAIVDLWTSRLRLFDKHYPPWKRQLARQMIKWGMSRKLTQESNAEVLAAYRQVQKLADSDS